MSRVTISLLLRLVFSGLIIFSIVTLPYTVAYAGGDSDGGDHDSDRDSDEKISDEIWRNTSKNSYQQTIRRAVQQKNILPLSKIKRIVKSKTKSEIIRVELERKKRRWVYEFKIVDRRGRLREIYVDATDGSILKSKNNR
jgi:uncharacterized membrane protein YkoI